MLRHAIAEKCDIQRLGIYVSMVTLTLRRHVGQVCCRWNHDRRHDVWNIWLHGSFFEAVVISSRQIIHTLSAASSSSAVASGYRVFMLRIARRERITSLNAFLKFLPKHAPTSTHIHIISI